jgi:hypothetical protein
VDVDPELAAHAVASLLDHSINMELAHPEMSDPERAVKLLSLVFTGLAAKDRLP